MSFFFPTRIIHGVQRRFKGVRNARVKQDHDLQDYVFAFMNVVAVLSDRQKEHHNPTNSTNLSKKTCDVLHRVKVKNKIHFYYFKCYLFHNRGQ